MIKKFFKALKQCFAKLVRKIKTFINGKEDIGMCDTIIVKRYRKWEKSGGDILPGPIEVPTSDTLYCGFFETEHGHYITTKITTKFFFIIPFSYDEYVIRVSKDMDSPSPYTFDSITTNDILNEIYEAENWNKYGHRSLVTGFDMVSLCGNDGVPIDHLEIGNNDYQYLKYSNI